jgi:hypothetical protein
MSEEQNRPETGVMQFGEDWPGVFIRGDNAAYLAMQLETYINNPDLRDSTFIKLAIEELLELLRNSNVRNIPTDQANDGVQYLKSFLECKK